MKPCRGFDPGSTPGPGANKRGRKIRCLRPSSLITSSRPLRGTPLQEPISVSVQSKSLLLNNMVLSCRVPPFHLSKKDRRLSRPRGVRRTTSPSALRAEEGARGPRWARTSSIFFGLSVASVGFYGSSSSILFSSVPIFSSKSSRSTPRRAVRVSRSSIISWVDSSSENQGWTAESRSSRSSRAS